MGIIEELDIWEKIFKKIWINIHHKLLFEDTSKIEKLFYEELKILLENEDD